MAKVPFRRRVSDFFTQGHWVVDFYKVDWTIALGGNIFIDSAPGFHFDSVGFNLKFWHWRFYVAWVDNN